MAKRKVRKCNLCGEYFSFVDEIENFDIEHEMEFVTKYEGETINLKLCANCLTDLIEKCAISPIKSLEKCAKKSKKTPEKCAN